MNERCLWCNRPDGPRVEFPARAGSRLVPDGWVHPEHEAALRAYMDRADRITTRLLAGMAIVLVFAVPAMLVAAAVGGERGAVAAVGAAIAAIGIVVAAYPFAPPLTVRWFGVRASIRVVRAVGVVLTANGAVLIVTAL